MLFQLNADGVHPEMTHHWAIVGETYSGLGERAITATQSVQSKDGASKQAYQPHSPGSTYIRSRGKLCPHFRRLYPILGVVMTVLLMCIKS